MIEGILILRELLMITSQLETNKKAGELSRLGVSEIVLLRYGFTLIAKVALEVLRLEVARRSCESTNPRDLVAFAVLNFQQEHGLLCWNVVSLGAIWF